MVDLDARPAPTPYTEGVARLNMFGMETINLYMFRLSKGKIGGRIWGTPVILLTASGRRTGKRYTKPLLALPDGDSWVLAASRGGTSRHPDWFGNLRAFELAMQAGDLATPEGPPLEAPEVTAEGGTVTPVRATVLKGAERARWWKQLNEVYPKFASYQERIPEREIPLIRLTPAH